MLTTIIKVQVEMKVLPITTSKTNIISSLMMNVLMSMVSSSSNDNNNTVSNMNNS